MKPIKLLLVSTLAAFCTLSALPTYATTGGASHSKIAGQPRMEKALTALTDARALLEKAEHNKGGWRASAIAATDKAIAETKRGIAFDNKNSTRDESVALGSQPNMDGALAQLREARTALENAEHDKGGWRVAALASTDGAIKATRKGIAFAN